LPMSPDLPADLLTCCLTTPIEIALRWIVIHNPLIQNVTPDMIMKIPGKLNDRRTPLGELNWIFTAITDTIAWNVLPSDMFQRLFRQDLMVAALFRNYLLADRIMRNYNCHPISCPALPQTHQHHMWDAWDLAADSCLSQLPSLLTPEGATIEYKHSGFFAEQLSAFEVWLKKGTLSSKPPQQLPIVLQVLLSQVHRLRALMLLSKFLDMGRTAVHLSLSVGIFPYVLKLLQSPATELRAVLVYIWAKLLAVDTTCQQDLLKDNGYTYFIVILSMPDSTMGAISNPSEHRAMCAFILSVFCHDFPAGQEVFFVFNLSLIHI
jgi:regulator-associated protein of mTOR